MALRVFATIAALFMPGVATSAPVVATDIAPVHSIAARVMQGIGEPGLILPPGASPHGYALRPSEARLLQDAVLVIWVGPDLTPWLADPIDALAPDATVVTLQDAPGMTLLPIRAGGTFEVHGPDDVAEHADGHDGHIWLDPGNAAVAARVIAAVLADEDPANADEYVANAEEFAADIAARAEAIAARLEPLRGKPFIVFHDAYQYFERAFDFPAAGSIALQDGVSPGTARVAKIRDRVREDRIVCAFSEPEFEPKLIAAVIEGTEARTGVLDGIGATLPSGPGLYPAVLEGIADALAACLGG